MRTFTSAATAIIALLAIPVLSKSVDITYDAESVSFFAPVSDNTSSEPVWIFPGTEAAQNIGKACAEVGSGAVTHMPGAGLEFQFSGTALSLVTAPNSAYSVSIDGEEPIFIHAPAAKRSLDSQPSLPLLRLYSRAPACGVTFASKPLPAGSHTVRIVASDQTAATDGVGLAFVRATVNDGNLPQPMAHAQTTPEYAQADQTTFTPAPKRESHTTTIAICATVGILAVLVPLVIFVICRRRRRSMPTQTRELDLESKEAPLPRAELMRQAPGRESTPSWVVHSITKKLKLDEKTGESVQVGAGADATKPKGPFRGRRASVRSSWTSFAAGSPRDLGTPIIGGGIGAGVPREANQSHTASVGSLNDTLTLLRPPVPPKNKEKKEKVAGHPFSKASIHPTRPKVGCPVLRIQT